MDAEYKYCEINIEHRKWRGNILQIVKGFRERERKKWKHKGQGVIHTGADSL